MPASASGLDAVAQRRHTAGLVQLVTGSLGLVSASITADKIVVLDAGRVRASGTDVELVADPLYAELAATQLLAAEPP